MRLMMLTASCGADWKPLEDIVIPEFQKYTERHGYGFMWLQGNYCRSDWKYPHQKTQWVHDVMVEHPEIDFFWVCDVDILITNHFIPVDEFLDETHNIFMARDISGNLNCGSYLLRNCPESLEYLETIVSMRNMTTSEQHAVIILSEEPKWFAMTKELSHPSINSSPWHLPHYASIGAKSVEEGNWKQGCLTCHLPGMQPLQRAKTFEAILPFRIP